VLVKRKQHNTEYSNIYMNKIEPLIMQDKFNLALVYTT